MVKPVTVWLKLTFISQMPFAGECACVAHFAKALGDCFLGRRKSQVVGFAEANGIVVAADVAGSDRAFQSSNPLGVSSGEKSRPGGGALGTVGVVLGQSDASRCQLIEDGSLNISAAVASQIAVAEVVRKNEHDVGSIGCREAERKRSERENPQPDCAEVPCVLERVHG